MNKIFALVGIITMGIGIAMLFGAGMQSNADAETGDELPFTLIMIGNDCYKRVPGGDAVSPGVIRLVGRSQSACGWNPTPTPIPTPEPVPDATCLDSWTGEPWTDHYVGEWPNGYYAGGEITCPTPGGYCIDIFDHEPWEQGDEVQGEIVCVE